MNVIGIDLGTTNSCVAILENKIVTIIKDDDGNTTIPSAVAFNEGEEFVGHAALPYRRNTKNYIYGNISHVVNEYNITYFYCRSKAHDRS